MDFDVEDIRDRPYIEARDIEALNFVRDSSKYLFRRHYRTGLRSHLFEVLNPGDVEKETTGVQIGDHLTFPRARPIKMLRLFRASFRNLEEALKEIVRVKLIIRYLAPAHVAKSNEFLVSYRLGKSREILLGGLQEYVSGEILDPWGPLDDRVLEEMLNRAPPMVPGQDGGLMPERVVNVKNHVRSFIGKVRNMIVQAGHIPDLAGFGNLILTADGCLKLVDINNISPVFPGRHIFRDDHGYPVCDKSIEALALLQSKILGNLLPAQDALYRPFLAPARMSTVAEMVRDFRASLGWSG